MRSRWGGQATCSSTAGPCTGGAAVDSHLRRHVLGCLSLVPLGEPMFLVAINGVDVLTEQDGLEERSPKLLL